MTDRINARIDEELARKLELLRERTGKTTSEIVKDSIELYYGQVAAPRALELLRDFVGAGTGDEHLSSNYKAHLTDSFASKTSS